MTGFPDKEVIAELTAKMLIEVEAVRFMTEKPFIFTSGWASPVYTDCRRLISFPRVRRTLIDFGVATIEREIGFEQFDAVAGGETAGIPFAAWMADRLMLPMQYVRKKPKGFGRNAQIEGRIDPGDRVLLVEDMTTDGRSKVNFCKALREAEAIVEHCFVFFFYDIFPEGKKILADLGVTLHALATWWDVLEVAKKSGRFDKAKLEEVETFMKDPAAWSKASAQGLRSPSPQLARMASSAGEPPLFISRVSTSGSAFGSVWLSKASIQARRRAPTSRGSWPAGAAKPMV